MSFFTCELRCHHLDRQDQLDSLKISHKHQKERLVEMEKAVYDAQTALEEYKIYIAKRRSFERLVQSTVGIDWIDRPDLLEKQWLEKKDWE